MKQELSDYIKKKYRVSPDHPWKKYPEYSVFRHSDNNKWFALVMVVGRDKLGLPVEGRVTVVNVKVPDPFFRDIMIREEGIMPSYHMNKRYWITVLLDGTVPADTVYDLLDRSYSATASARKKEKIRPPKEWIIPANPKYYDIVHAFDNADEIEWKQGSGIKAGDVVFLYVAAPVSAILYQCRVTADKIPCDFKNEKLTIRALMRIKLLKRYGPEAFPFAVLKEEYGIYAVRGPRGIPHSLSCALNK